MSKTEEIEPVEAPKGRLLRGIEAMFAQLWRWGALYLLIAVSGGLALWPMLHPRSMGYIIKNDLSIAHRQQMLATLAISFVVTTAAYFAVWRRRRRTEPKLSLGDSIVATNRWAFIALVAPLLTAFNVARIEVKHPIFTGFLMVAITALAMAFFYRLLGLKWFAPPADPFVPARHAKLAKGLFWASALGYAGLFAYYSILDHQGLGTSVYDLGIYDNLVWQTAHGNFLACTLIKGGNHMSAHFDPILWLLAQIYRFYQHAETLLVVQAVWLASGALPLWALAMRRLKNEWMAAILALIYLLHPALHGVNMFDFHSVALVVPLAMWAVYLLDVGGLRRYWLVFALLLITREDISLLNCFIGAYAILIGHTRTGLATIFLSLVYLVAVKSFVMADSALLMSADKAYSYVYFYEEMIPHAQEGAGGLLTTLFVNPLYALQIVFKEEKLLFFLHVLLPMLALPLVAGRKLVLMIHGLLFVGLASRKHLFSLHFQYSALLFPMLFAALPDGVARVTDSRRLRALGFERARVAWAVVLAMLTGALLVSMKRGVIFDNASFVAGWTRLVKKPSQEMKDRYAKVQEIVAQIGPDAAVSASNELGPHVSNRLKAYHWPTINDADYLLLYTTTFKKDELKRLERLVKRKKFRVLEDHLGVQLLERIDVAELDEEFRDEKRGQRPREPEPDKAKARAKPKGATKPTSAGSSNGDTSADDQAPTTGDAPAPATSESRAVTDPPVSGAGTTPGAAAVKQGSTSVSPGSVRPAL